MVAAVWPKAPVLVLEVVAGHHERPGGHGYPARLKNPTRAMQIVAACDAYAAVREHRLYRSTPPLSHVEAIEIIRPWTLPEVLQALKHVHTWGPAWYFLGDKIARGF